MKWYSERHIEVFNKWVAYTHQKSAEKVSWWFVLKVNCAKVEYSGKTFDVRECILRSSSMSRNPVEKKNTF